MVGVNKSQQIALGNLVLVNINKGNLLLQVAERCVNVWDGKGRTGRHNEYWIECWRKRTDAKTQRQTGEG